MLWLHTLRQHMDGGRDTQKTTTMFEHRVGVRSLAASSSSGSSSELVLKTSKLRKGMHLLFLGMASSIVL
jgi:hypothetical protein